MGVKLQALRAGVAEQVGHLHPVGGLQEPGLAGAQGDRAVMLFVIQRSDCDAFAAAADIDPAYAAGLERAAANGVEVLAYACELSPEAVEIAGRVGCRLGPQEMPFQS